MKSEVQIRVVENARQRVEAFGVRLAVFHSEQGIPASEEFDPEDEVATHVLASLGPTPVGTGRLLDGDGYARIGRMAVLKEFRGRGIGTGVVQALMAIGRKRGFDRFVLHAQLQAVPFYESVGFRRVGPEFDEVNIPHCRMERSDDTD